MLKENNVVHKFREFWANLDGKERSYLWDILTALRGADVGSDQVKMFTTARIRGELLGRDFYKGFVFTSFHLAKTHNHSCESYSPKKVVAMFKKEKAHFYCHVVEAIEALARYRPKSAMRDLMKFTRIRG